ncbi:hypothetical protein [Streptomyces sp. NPDC015130]|uniref:hypothetical protein n=1 Tax=Streptomyces sp. NPDC015130 TaxID=3364940 RepID=UPI0036F85474
MTEQPEACRSTQHCATHGFCHRCTPSLADASQHLVKAIDAAGITTGSGRVYAQLAATVRDAARQTGACSCGEPATPDVVHCQGAPCYMDQDGGLQTVELPAPAARQTGHQPDTGARGRCPVMFEGGTQCEKDADHRAGRRSDDPHVPGAAPAAGLDNNQPADAPLTAAERQFLTFALDLADNRMANRSDEFTTDDYEALARLRRTVEEGR